MFPALQNEIDIRFGQVERHIQASPRTPTDTARTIRGLAFVQIYAVYEYTVRSLITVAVAQLVACGHRLGDLRPSLLALFLDAEINSLRDVGEEKQWDRRLILFEQAFSKNPLSVVSVMPHDGSHYRHTQLLMIFRTLGINRSLTVRRRHLYLIDEIVNNRNSIAHGEESPLDIGSRFSKQDMMYRIKTMQNICRRLVRLVGEYCATPARHRK